jgi:hypothetical protein
MTGQQAAFDQVRYLMSIGQIQANQANVEIVRIMGVRLIEARISRAVRTELNSAVKSGRLGHLPKDGLMPEAYFHPNALGRALEERDRVARASVNALRGVLAHNDGTGSGYGFEEEVGGNE